MKATGDTSLLYVHAGKEVVSSFFCPKGVVSGFFSERRKAIYKDNAESTTTNHQPIIKDNAGKRGLFLPSLAEWGQNIALIRTNDVNYMKDMKNTHYLYLTTSLRGVFAV